MNTFLSVLNMSACYNAIWSNMQMRGGYYIEQQCTQNLKVDVSCHGN